MIHQHPEDPYRWTPEEYALRCEQGDDIAELIVEGQLDRHLFEDALRRWGLKHVEVIDDDYFRVSDAEVVRAGFDVGVKGRLLTVAACLQALVDDAITVTASVAVVVDRDYDETSTGSPTFLLATDGHSLESYSLAPQHLDRFARLILGRTPRPARKTADTSLSPRASCTGQELYERLVEVSCQMAGLRRSLQSLAVPIGLPDLWKKWISVDQDGYPRLDEERAFNRTDSSALVRAEYARSTALAESDPFRWVRGHDYVALLLMLLRSRWGETRGGALFHTKGADTLARCLLTSTDPAQLDLFPLFKALRRRFELPA